MAGWITVKEAARKLSVSERNVRFKVSSGKLKAKRDGRRWLVHSSLSADVSDTGRIPEAPAADTEVIQMLKSEIEKRDKQLEEKDRQMAKLQEELSERSQRQDTIILQLTRQMEQSQRMLEYHQSPWYHRWFSRKRKEGED